MHLPGVTWLVDSKRHSAGDLKTELISIKDRLRQIAFSLDRTEHAADAQIEQLTEYDVRRYIQWRSRRSSVLEAKFLTDPAWDMLVELFASFLGQRRISVSSLCGVAGVPATTALRWINVLESQGLVVRTDDPMDGRRTFVALSEVGKAKMSAFFEKSSLPSPV